MTSLEELVDGARGASDVPMRARIEKLMKRPTLSSPACAVEKVKEILGG